MSNIDISVLHNDILQHVHIIIYTHVCVFNLVYCNTNGFCILCFLVDFLKEEAQMQMDEEEDDYRPSTGDYIPPSVPIVSRCCKMCRI